MAIKHIDNVIVPRTHSPLYMIHKYWARKPENVVRSYIEAYSSPGDIVLDPFVGSGVAAIEAVMAGRKAVALDLNPMAVFITRCSAMKCNLDSLQREFLTIEQQAKPKIEDLYETTCPDHPREQTQILCGIWEENKLTRVWVDCSDQGPIQRSARVKDRQQCGEVEGRRLTRWAPDFQFPPGVVFDQAIREAGDHLRDLFTPRAWYALSILRKSIEDVKNPENRDLLLLTFTSMLGQVSKMVPSREGAKLSGNVGWTVHSYWVPPANREFNVWNAFANRFRRTMAAKLQSNRDLNVVFAKSFNELVHGQANLLIANRSALGLSDIVPENSIDYVFTDPPYGGSIPYLELSTLWAKWAEGPKAAPAFRIDLREEITVDPKYQKKDFDYYHKMLTSVFRQVYSCLKTGRYATVTFHNPQIEVWNSIVRALADAGFNMEKILYQPPPRASIGGLSRPYGSAIGDYYLRLAKVDAPTKTSGTDDERLYERIIVDTAKHVIAERGEPTPYTFILNSIVPALKQGGVLLASRKGWDDVLKEHLGTDFVLVDVIEGGKVIGHSWGLAHPENIPYLDIVPLSERVDGAVLGLLNRRVKASFDEILQDVFIKFPNAMTPTTKSVTDVVESVAEKTPDGKWQLRPDVKGRESQHMAMSRYLAQLGLAFGFEVYAAPPAPALPNILTTIPPLPGVDNPARVAMIDVLWLKRNSVAYAFEVENTTGFIAAIARGSNLPTSAARFIVLPEERADDLNRKLLDPSVESDYKKYGWRRIFYNRLEDYWERGAYKKAKLADALMTIVERPMPAKFGVPQPRSRRTSGKPSVDQAMLLTDGE